MGLPRAIKSGLWLSLAGALTYAGVTGYRSYQRKHGPPRSGEAVYAQDCRVCHGPMGEGVAGKADEALFGEKTPTALARYIVREMPDDDPGSLSEADAASVAAYIHGKFYSPEARARNNPPRIELAHLTVRQYRETMADLLGSFRPKAQAAAAGGLHAVYHDSDGMNKRSKKALERDDLSVDFDYAAGAPAPGMKKDQFSVSWEGSLLVRDTGLHAFRVTTPNGARLYLNSPVSANENTRDDSGALGRAATIDLWVSSGAVRTGEAELLLLGGRSYPLKLDFFKYKDKTASIRLEWRPPGGVWEVIPPERLSAERSSRTDVVAADFPADDASLGYERGVGVSREWTEAVARGAFEAADLLDSKFLEYAGTSAEAKDKAAKLSDFCLRLAERAYRRPLEAAEKDALRAVFAPGLAPETAARRATLRILSSPQFLYPDHRGQSSHAVAARLALALWDSLPDEELLKTAAAGGLRDPAQVRVQARRMMQDPRARAKLADFFRHWLHVEEDADLAKDAQAYPGFDHAVVADLLTSLDLTVERVVWSEKSDYRDLLLGDTVLLNGRLAKFYGQPGPQGRGFAPVRLDAEHRAGVLTHPYVLATLSYHKSSSPIHRGVFVTRNILGRMLRPPPMAIAFMDDKFDPSLTMREKVTELTSKPACMSCHVTINPLGFSLERFDAVGRLRATDNLKPVDPVSEYQAPDGSVIRLQGARDVARHAVESPGGQAGFVRNLFHALVRQPPAAWSPDAVGRLADGFRSGGFHVRDLAVEVAVMAALTPPLPN
jgi:hypothetical protein